MRRRDCDLPRIPAVGLEEAVIGTLKKEFSSPELFNAIYQSAQVERSIYAQTLEAERKDTETRITGLSRQIDNITNAIGENGHTKPLLDKMNRLEIERSELQMKLTEMRKNANALLEKLTDEQLITSVRKMGEILDSQDEQTVRTFLRGLIQRIVVDRKEDRIVGVITINIDDDSDDDEGPRPPSLPLGPRPTRRNPTVAKTRYTMGAQKKPPVKVVFLFLPAELCCYIFASSRMR
jgi:hypothetical protein